MTVRFNPPPGWPVPSRSWSPGDDWMPDPSWPAPPAGWSFWSVDRPARPAPALLGTFASKQSGIPAPHLTLVDTTPVTSYGSDHETWLSELRASVEQPLAAATSPEASAEPASADEAPADESWALEGVLASASGAER